MIANYFAKPLEVIAIQFDGLWSTGLIIRDLFPKENIELVYDYSRLRIRLCTLIGQRYYEINETDYAVRGALGELFVYRENIFHEMFDLISTDP